MLGTKAQFHVTIITQTNKSMVNFILRHNLKLCVPDANTSTNFDVKSA